MAAPNTLENLANILSLRKRNAKPYNLLLTSTISLTPAVLTDIVGLDNWPAFCAHLKSMGQHDRLYLLNEHLNETEEMPSYKALAKLLVAGYFSTVLTTNVDSFLENALFEQNVPSSAYETLVLDRDQDRRIADALEREPDTMRIVKLRGSLSDGVIPEAFPEIFELRSAMRTGLERYLNQDIVIVGSIERDDDLRRSLSTRGGSIYYAVPYQPPGNDEVLKTLNARRQDPAIHVISGSNGDFSTFFQSLAVILLEKTPTLRNSGTVIQTPPHTQTLSPPVIPEQPIDPVALPVSESLKPVQMKVMQPELAPAVPETDRGAVQENTATLAQAGGDKQAQVVAKTEGKQPHTTVHTMIIRVVIVVVSIVTLLATLAWFINLTNTHDPLFMIPLLIIVVVTVFGAAGIINADQITQILLKALGVKNESDAKAKKEKG